MKRIFNSGMYKYANLILLTATLAFISPKHYHSVSVTEKAATGIVFIEDSWDEALKQAAKQNKYIFVDAYATWCGPCKMLKARTFTDTKAAAFYNANFVNVAIDMEKGRGPELAQKWQLRAYPTLIIFDPKGKPVLGTVGFINASELIRFGREALKK
ncbi:thioredoxin family protein [Mucilaginibacter sp. L3T2-6]|uniref:thioredoxin family protein n=1 Tax=Mucilaginibacter sp. L3T2-6 TaxID=3062491 RepID=UPI002676031B|nr:thioredoxin family protein [Mucilaginibacter sp. L3T2-6]MDO3644240.1 thioredoxin family protein [Mucilaginibacter sp. L3T2-6]MDV6216663.1 thioredoxin family protein [Mucilaginibacter sp. L3T2-6]